jgi:HAD superfamily hydrolase (TIGR01662 family)
MSIWPELDGVRAILLDFDGPICSVFAGFPAPKVATELRAKLTSYGADTTDEAAATSDPLAVLRWASAKYPELSETIDSQLTSYEKTAIRTAQPTHHAHRAIKSARRAGLSVAVVSNNSGAAISDYLCDHAIQGEVDTIAARQFGRPELMKPNPRLVIEATQNLGVPPEQCAFVGDSVTDIEAGRAAGVRVIGYAKTPRHGEALAAAAPDFLIDSMSVLADAFGGEETCPL